MGIGTFVRRSISFSRRSRSLDVSDLKWANSGELTDEETGSGNGTDLEMVDLVEVENEVEDREGVEAVVNFDDESVKVSFPDGSLSDTSTKMVDRTPSKVEKQLVEENLTSENEIKEEPAEEQLVVPPPTPRQEEPVVVASKPRYTKEEKQRRFVKELFRISTQHLKCNQDVRDDDSIVSSAVGSVSSLPPPTTGERILQFFSCATSFQSKAVYPDSPSECFFVHFPTTHRSNNEDPVAEEVKPRKDDDSLDQALAGIPLPESEPDQGDTPGVVNLIVSSPITVPGEECSEVAEVIESEEGSAVSVKYSVRHVTSVQN